MKKTILTLIFILSFVCYGEKITLKTDLQDSRPKTIKNSDGTYSGLAIELMNLIEKNSEYKFSYSKEFIPTARIERNLESGEADLHFGFGKTDEREKKFVLSEKLYDLQFIMISNASDDIVIKSPEDIKKLGKSGTVLAVLGTNAVEYLKKDLGFTVDDGARDITINFEKLLNNRARFFVYNDLATIYEMNLQNYRGKFKVQPIEMEKFEHYVMFSKSTPKTVVDGIGETIKKLKKSGEWDKIVDKYIKN